MDVSIDRIVEIIKLFAAPGASIEAQSRMLEDGLIDSLNVIQITMELEREFGKKIPVMEVTIDDLATPATLCEALNRVWS